MYENSADPSTLTSYEVYDKKADDWIDYARNSLRGTFTKYSRNWESLVSPDGYSLAGRGRNYTSDNYDSVIITNRKTGDKTSIKTVRKPLISSIRAWSKDGSKILLNIEKESGKDWLYLGFVIVDVAAEDAKVVNVADTSVRKTAFGWDGEEEGVVNMSAGQGLRFFDTTGKATRTLANIGTLPSGTQDIFSPSGKVFITNCPEGWRRRPLRLGHARAATGSAGSPPTATRFSAGTTRPTSTAGSSTTPPGTRSRWWTSRANWCASCSKSPRTLTSVLSSPSIPLDDPEPSRPAIRQ